MDKVTITLTVTQLNVIMAALGKAPYEAVAELVQELRDQALPQINKPTAE
jgi:hypothetical protein